MRQLLGHVMILWAVTFAIFFTNLGQPRLWDRDEPRNAGCAAEMLARGEFVVPIFNDQLRHQKPILLYWLIMSAYEVFGVNEFAARFWSAVLAVGTTMATYAIGRRLYNPSVGLVAALALSSSLMFVVAARAATPDSVLIFCSTLSLMIYVLGAFPKEAAREAGMRPDAIEGPPSNRDQPSFFFPKRYLVVVLMYAVMGLGVLAKGPVGFLLPMAMIGLFGLIHTRHRVVENQQATANRLPRLKAGLVRWATEVGAVFSPMHFLRTLWAMRPVTAAVLILTIALPWFLLVHFRTEGDFTRMFFVGEHFGRATEAMESHSGGLWFYPVAILAGFFPWSCFWGPTLIGLISNKVPTGSAKEKRAGGSSEAGNLFLVVWVLIQVGAFSMAKTKLPSYVTPCYPALAILTASCLVGLVEKLRRKKSQSDAEDRQTVFQIFPINSNVHLIWFYVAFAAMAVSGLAIALGLWFGLGLVLPSERSLALLGAIPLIAGGVSLFLIYDGRPKLLLPTVTAAAILFCVGLFGYATVAVDKQQMSHLVLDEIRIREDVRVGTYGCMESTWVFYGQKPITELTVSDSENQSREFDFLKDPGWTQDERKFWKPVPRQSVQKFLSAGAAYIVTTDEYLESLEEKLPSDYVVLKTAPYFLKQRTLFLIGPDEAVGRTGELLKQAQVKTDSTR